jgi:LacI family transcriptional regulator
MPLHPRRIGLVLSYSLGYCRGILRGVRSYAERKPDWVFAPVDPEGTELERLLAWKPAGIIAHIFSRELAQSLAAFRKPLVNVSSIVSDLPYPCVGIDDAMIGRLAATHLLERGFRRFGFAGQPAHFYSNQREAGFRAAIESAGFKVASYHERGRSFCPRGRLWTFDAAVRHWLAALEKPVGVFAPSDSWGLQLTEMCRQQGLRIPEDVALVGVDNDDLLCELARPSLSSIAVPAELIGFEAAAVLDRLMSGPRPKPPLLPLLLPPLGVITRRSSDILAIADEDLAASVQYIREHAHRPIQVKDVLDVVLVSRRSLERRFRTTLGRSVSQEICCAHMERARNLLSRTEMSMSEVAHNSGFSAGKQLSIVFRREMGLTPSMYRRGSRRPASKLDLERGTLKSNADRLPGLPGARESRTSRH